jgi:hypothetical protein
MPPDGRPFGLGAMRGLREHVTPEAMRLRAGDRTYRRGRDCADEGRVVDLAEDGPAITGTVEGTHDYGVVLAVDGDDLVGTCDCPMGETSAFCKHLVALGLAWLAQAGEVPAPDTRATVRRQARPRRITLEDIRSHLASMDHGDLVDLVLAQAERDDLLRERLLLLVAAVEADGAGSALVRRAIDQAVRVPDFLRYADVHGYVTGIHRPRPPAKDAASPTRSPPRRGLAGTPPPEASSLPRLHRPPES